MNRAAKLFVPLAGGWVLLTIALSQSLPPAELSLALGTVVFAECLSYVIYTQNASDKVEWIGADQERLANSLLGWIFLCVLLLPLFQLRFMSFFQGQPSALLSLLALTLVLTLLKHFSAAQSRSRGVEAMRLIAPALYVFALNWSGARSIGLVLSGIILSHLILLLVVVLFSRKASVREWQHYHAPRLIVLAQYADLLICPFILSGTNALLYIAARGLAGAVSAVLAQLGGQAIPALVTAREERNRLQFTTMAARLNLGFLLVGGSAGLAALTIGPYVASALQLEGTGFHAVLFWLVLGASAPAFFGATEAILQATKRQNISLLSHFIGIGIIISATLFARQPDAVLLAKGFAAVQLIKTAACALILIRNAGVWPGLTALLLRQIKLF